MVFRRAVTYVDFMLTILLVGILVASIMSSDLLLSNSIVDEATTIEKSNSAVIVRSALVRLTGMSDRILVTPIPGRNGTDSWNGKTSIERYNNLVSTGSIVSAQRQTKLSWSQAPFKGSVITDNYWVTFLRNGQCIGVYECAVSGSEGIGVRLILSGGGDLFTEDLAGLSSNTLCEYLVRYSTSSSLGYKSYTTLPNLLYSSISSLESGQLLVDVPNVTDFDSNEPIIKFSTKSFAIEHATPVLLYPAS